MLFFFLYLQLSNSQHHKQHMYCNLYCGNNSQQDKKYMHLTLWRNCKCLQHNSNKLRRLQHTHI